MKRKQDTLPPRSFSMATRPAFQPEPAAPLKA